MKLWLLATALLLAPALGAAAQDGPAGDPLDAPPTPAPAVVEVAVGETDWPVLAGEPLMACVVERRQGLETALVTLRLIVREGEAWLAQPAFETAATGAVADWRAGDCGALDPEPANR